MRLMFCFVCVCVSPLCLPLLPPCLCVCTRVCASLCLLALTPSSNNNNNSSSSIRPTRPPLWGPLLPTRATPLSTTPSSPRLTLLQRGLPTSLTIMVLLPPSRGRPQEPQDPLKGRP